ncbi:MAG: phospholipase, partial [Deltaproteobacteria bacterium]|nr:phospholipase [Deltaproteobacteria bacterium]
IVRVSVDGQQEVILGSANLTRRNIDNFNLETDLYISGSQSLPIMARIADYIDRVWHNRDGHCYTLDYELYAEKSLWKTWQYRLQESLGLCTF